MGFRNGFYCSQAQPESFHFFPDLAPMKSVENAGELLDGDSCPLISHRYADFIFIMHGRNNDPAVSLRELDGIIDEIGKNPSQLGCVGLDGR